MLEAALTYLKDSEEATRTVLIGGLLGLFAFLLVPILPVLGYLVRVLDRTADGDDEAPTFEDWEALVVDGLKTLAIAIAYLLVPLALVLVFAGGGALVASATSLDSLGALLALAGSALGLVAGLAVWYILPAAIARFANDGSLGAAFELRALEPVLRSGAYARGWLYGFVINVVGAAFVGALAAIPILGWIAAPFLAFYVQVAATYAYGRGYGESLDVDLGDGAAIESEQPVV